MCAPRQIHAVSLPAFLSVKQICPEMRVNEMHALYDKQHKVSSFVESHQNTHNSFKYEVMWKWHLVMLIHKEHWISLTCISGCKCSEGKYWTALFLRFLDICCGHITGFFFNCIGAIANYIFHTQLIFVLVFIFLQKTSFRRRGVEAPLACGKFQLINQERILKNPKRNFAFSGTSKKRKVKNSLSARILLFFYITLPEWSWISLFS